MSFLKNIFDCYDMRYHLYRRLSIEGKVFTMVQGVIIILATTAAEHGHRAVLTNLLITISYNSFR